MGDTSPVPKRAFVVMNDTNFHVWVVKRPSPVHQFSGSFKTHVTGVIVFGTTSDRISGLYSD